MASPCQQFPIGIPLFIQNFLFGFGQLEVLEGGYNSDVLLFSHSRQVIVKIIGGKKDINLTLPEATRLGQQIAKYRKLLKTTGVPVPGFLEWAVTQDEETGRVYLFVTEPYSGLPSQSLVNESNHLSSLLAARRVMEAVTPLLGMKPIDGFLNLGLDPKTSNFVFASDGRSCTYVDFMPPRYKDDDGNFLVEYPQLLSPCEMDLWKWRYFTHQGLATITLYQLGRLCPSLFQGFKAKTVRWLTDNGHYETAAYLEFLNDLAPRRIKKLTNLYMLRLAMCELVSHKRARISQHEVEDFFLKTHVEGELSGPLLHWSQNRLAEIAKALN